MTSLLKHYANLIALCLIAILAFDAGLAHAAAGRGGSMGSRGARTYMAPPPTQTMPRQAAPIERSVTPPAATAQVQRPGLSGPPVLNSQPSWVQRNPFMSGLLGGFIGSGIAGMLFGHSYGYGMGGGMGFASGLGTMLQFLLIGGLGWWIYKRFASNRANAAEPMTYSEATHGFGASRIPQVDLPPHQYGGYQAPPRIEPANSDELGISARDFTEFERALIAIQQAWSKGDIAVLRRLVTPEMLSYFSEQLADSASRGVANVVADVKLEQGDLAESWREGDVEYATTALRFSALDYDTSLDDSSVVRGSKDTRTTITESWTFMRHAGTGRWLLSAIQQ